MYLSGERPKNEDIRMNQGFHIATVPLPNGGRIGLCPLPGSSGSLDADLEVVRQWQPAIVISLTELAEMTALGSGDLGERLQDSGIDWVHFPVRNYQAPGSGRIPWTDLSLRLHTLLDDGKGVLLHCRYGQGRAGTIALRLLVERGENENTGLLRLRAAREQAVETVEQLNWARGRDRYSPS